MGIKPVFRIRLCINNDPVPGFYLTLNAVSDTDRKAKEKNNKLKKIPRLVQKHF
jgi:hypothetical protein